MSQNYFERPQLLIPLLPVAAKKPPSIPGPNTEGGAVKRQEIPQSIRKTTPRWLNHPW